MAKRKAGPRWRLRLLLPALLVAGCTVGPDFVAPRAWFPKSWFSSQPPGAAAPGSPVSSEPVAETIQPEWWAGFRDPELTSIEKRVAAANLDVRAATIRLAESRAERRITAAAEFPQINGSAFYMRQLPSEKGVLSLFGSSGSSTETAGANGIPSTVTGTQIPAFNLWQYGFDASWELDLWGRVRRSIEAADATIEASAEARRDILLSVLAEVARDYIQLRGIQTQLQISRANLRIARESLALTKMRAANGLATELDVADASAQVSTTEATIPRLEEQQAQAINRLSFLLGEPPRTLAAELATPHAIPPVPPKVPVGLPSELAHRRPDIRQAEAQLHAQTAEIGVAVANFYPAITLNGSFALQAVDFKNLGSWAARTYTIGPGISLPIFEGGRLVGSLRLTEAQQQEAAILYQRTVLAAWQEVDDALTAYAAEQAPARKAGAGGGAEPPGTGSVTGPIQARRYRLPSGAHRRAAAARGGAANGGQHHDRFHEPGFTLQGAGRRVGRRIPETGKGQGPKRYCRRGWAIMMCARRDPHPPKASPWAPLSRFEAR